MRPLLKPGYLDQRRHTALLAFLFHDHMHLGAEPIGDRRGHAWNGQHQTIERSLCRFSLAGITHRPARLLASGGLHGLALAHRFFTGMNNYRLSLDGLLVKIDLKTKGRKRLAGPGDGLAISE